MSEVHNYELQVQDMTCSHCEASVMKAVKHLDGAARVEISLAAKQVRVASSADIDAVSAAIMDAGFPVTGARDVG